MSGLSKENIVFHGKLSELYRLAKEGKIPTTLQGSHTRPCKFWTAAKVLSGIRNSVILAHGPSGCAYGVKQAYKLTNSRNSGSPYVPVLSTNINLKNVIYGGEKDLRSAIFEVDKKYHPDVIVIATSCATGIIGDNVDAIVEEIRDQVHAEIMAIHCEGFSGEYRSGFDLVFKQMVNFMNPPRKDLQEKFAHSVNIVGAKMGPERTEVDTDVKELIRLVEGMGAEVHAVIAGDCTLKQLKEAPSVAVNCALCLDLGYPLGKAMKETYGTPMNSCILPYGIDATEKWLKGAARYMHMEKEADAFIASEREAIRKEYERAKSYLSGKLAIVEGHDAIKSLSIAHMLERDFDMHVVIYNFHPWSTAARETSIDYMLETGLDPEVLITKGTLAFGRYESMQQTEEELLAYLGNVDPKETVFFGSSLSYPHIPLVDLNAILNRPRFGYRGALKVAECIITALNHADRPRSWLTKEIVFPKDAGLVSASSLTDKLSTEMPDCAVYAGRRRRGQCMMN